MWTKHIEESAHEGVQGGVKKVTNGEPFADSDSERHECRYLCLSKIYLGLIVLTYSTQSDLSVF